MDNVSKVIFTCLAIGYTFLIYQNNQLKDDLLELQMTVFTNNILIDENSLEQDEINKTQKQVNEELVEILVEINKNTDTLFKNVDILEENRVRNTGKINYIEDYLEENFGKK